MFLHYFWYLCFQTDEAFAFALYLFSRGVLVFHPNGSAQDQSGRWKRDEKKLQLYIDENQSAPRSYSQSQIAQNSNVLTVSILRPLLLSPIFVILCLLEKLKIIIFFPSRFSTLITQKKLAQPIVEQICKDICRLSTPDRRYNKRRRPLFVFQKASVLSFIYFCFSNV